MFSSPLIHICSVLKTFKQTHPKSLACAPRYHHFPSPPYKYYKTFGDTEKQGGAEEASQRPSFQDYDLDVKIDSVIVAVAHDEFKNKSFLSTVQKEWNDAPVLIDARCIFDEEDAKGRDFIINEHVAFRKVMQSFI